MIFETLYMIYNNLQNYYLANLKKIKIQTILNYVKILSMTVLSFKKII